MKLDRVTITGADDSISPLDLLTISEAFPFVEWGILVSNSHTQEGSPRFPSMKWVDQLQCTAKHRLNLSLHVCGKWVRDLLIGVRSLPCELADNFQRIQLNFHAERTLCKPKEFHMSLQSFANRQFIFQIDGAKGNQHLESLYAENDLKVVDAVPLFDISGGAGILPTEWPKPQYINTDVDYCYHGYAGGLGPENLTEQLPKISDAAGDARIWIDMETRVRSADDKQFEKDKVIRCLEIAEPFVKSSGLVTA